MPKLILCNKKATANTKKARNKIKTVSCMIVCPFDLVSKTILVRKYDFFKKIFRKIMKDLGFNSFTVKEIFGG